MTRSAILAATLALFVALFSLASWGRAEINNPQTLATSSSRALQSEQVRALLTEKIVDEVWQRVDAQKEIASLLPPDVEILSGPAAFASRAALASAVDRVLQTKFIGAVWERSIQVAYQNTLRALQNRNSALLIQKETIYLDIQVVLQTTAKEIGLPPSLWQNIPPGLGQIKIAEATDVAQVQRIYSIVSLAPPILLIASVLTLVLLLLANRRALWQGFLWTSGALLLAGLTVFLSQEAFSPLLVSSISDPFSAALTEAIWNQWSRSIRSAGTRLFWLAGASGLVALLLSPLLGSLRSQALDDAKKQSAIIQARITELWKKEPDEK